MTDRSRLRLVVLRVLVLSLLLTLFGRAWYLQVASGDQYVAAATKQGTRSAVTPAVRGIVLDAQGRPLVTNKSALVVSVSRRDLPAGKDASYAVLVRVGKLIGKPAGLLKASIRPCGPTGDGKVITQPCSLDEPFQPVPVATLPDGDAVALRTALTIQENPEQFPGISVDRRGVRQYEQAGAQPGTRLAAQTLGYVGPVNSADVAAHPDYDARSSIGRGGVEQTYDGDLRGVPGRQVFRVDRNGQTISEESTTPPAPGSDLVLNLDGTIQKAAEEALHKALSSYAPASKSASHPRTGAAVVLTSDGRVVALASAPSFDPSVFYPAISDADYAQLSDPANDLPLNNKAVDGQYSPGSAYKPVTASAVLADGIVSPGAGLACPPVVDVGNQSFHNFEGEAPKPGDLRYMLEVSCDTVFDKFAYNQWQADGGLRQAAGESARPAREIFAKMARAYGFGASPGIDLPGGGSAGAVVDRATRLAQYRAPAGPLSKAYNCKRQNQVPVLSYEQQLARETCSDGFVLRGGEATQSAIGQGSLLQSTPLQMARAYAALANGGTLYEPTLAKALVRPDGTVVRSLVPRATGKLPISPADLDYLRQGLYQVTHGKDGTARDVFKDFPVDIAGKTGTAEVDRLVNGQLTKAGDNSWFMSLGPYKPGQAGAPRFVVAVVIPDSGQGAQIAAPAARDIWSAIFGVQGTGKGARVTNPNAGVPRALPCFVPGKVLPDAPGRCGKAPTKVTGVPIAPTPRPSPSGAGPAPATASGPVLPGLGEPAPSAVPGLVPDRRTGGRP